MITVTTGLMKGKQFKRNTVPLQIEEIVVTMMSVEVSNTKLCTKGGT